MVSLTGDTQVLGTLDFLSPEQATASIEVDARADIYSLGCTLYYLLVGSAPFAHEKSVVQKMMAHANEAPASVNSLRTDCPAELEAIVERMLAKDPTERVPSCEEVASLLSPFAKGADLSAIAQTVQHGTDSSHSSADMETVALQGVSTLHDTSPETQPAAPTKVMQSDVKVRRSQPKWAALGVAVASILIALTVILTLQTKNGTLIVEADDSAELMIQKERVRFRNTKTDEWYELSVGEKPLKPGEYEINVTSDSGLSFAGGTTFTVSRDGKAVVNATLKQAERQPTDDVTPNVVEAVKNAPVELQQRVATWVFRSGGRLIVETGGESRIYGKVEALPEVFTITGIVELRRGTDTSALELPPQLPSLKLFESLRALTTDRELRHLAECRQLERIVVAGEENSDEGIRELGKLKALRELQLSSTSVTDSGLRSLTACEAIELLHLSGNGQLTESTIDVLHEFPKLSTVALEVFPFTRKGIVKLSQLENVTTLTLRYNGESLTDDDMAVLATMRSLTSLHIDESGVNGRGDQASCQRSSHGNINHRNESHGRISGHVEQDEESRRPKSG